MTQNRINQWEQPVGFPVQAYEGATRPEKMELSGRTCRLAPTDVEAHAAPLYAAFVVHGHDRFWTYLPYGPFADLPSFERWMRETTQGDDPFFYTIIDQMTAKPIGLASYLRINPAFGSIEVGHIHFSTLLQRTPAATESMYLMMKYAFETLGYRRYEWKCDALNEPSRRAAKRFGFTFEGVFRQHLMYKGRNRDTAWFSIVDSEWPALKMGYEQWLAPDNFNEDGSQKERLQTFLLER